MLSANEIQDWIAAESPGAVLCYFIGSLANAADTNHEIMLAGEILWNAAMNGEVYLTQKRLTKDAFSYWVRKAKHKKTLLERQIRDNKWR